MANSLPDLHEFYAKRFPLPDLDKLCGKRFRLVWEAPVAGRNNHPGIEADDLPYYRLVKARSGSIGVWGPGLLFVSVGSVLAQRKVEYLGKSFTLKQLGDKEATYLFPAKPKLIDKAASVIKAYRRKQLSEETKSKLREQVAIARSKKGIPVA